MVFTELNATFRHCAQEVPTNDAELLDIINEIAGFYLRKEFIDDEGFHDEDEPHYSFVSSDDSRTLDIRLRVPVEEVMLYRCLIFRLIGRFEPQEIESNDPYLSELNRKVG